LRFRLSLRFRLRLRLVGWLGIRFGFELRGWCWLRFGVLMSFPCGIGTLIIPCRRRRGWQVLALLGLLGFSWELDHRLSRKTAGGA
jgi:hypothetical protein